MKIQQLSQNLTKIAQNFGKILNEVSNEKRNDILELQKDQFYAGLGGDNKSINPTYRSDSYAKYKSSLRQRRENILFGKRAYYIPNLIITGSHFYDLLEVDIKDSLISINADNSPIIVDLKTKYGDFIGFNDISKEYLVYKIIYPRLKEAIIDELRMS